MARTITLTIPPNTTVNLPSSEILEKLVDGAITISIDNQSGETITSGAAGSATSFTIDDLPASIADSVSDDIVLTVVSAGDIDFDFLEDNETISVSIQEEEEEEEGVDTELPECNISAILIAENTSASKSCNVRFRKCRITDRKLKEVYIRGALVPNITVCSEFETVVKTK